MTAARRMLRCWPMLAATGSALWSAWAASRTWSKSLRCKKGCAEELMDGAWGGMGAFHARHPPNAARAAYPLYDTIELAFNSILIQCPRNTALRCACTSLVCTRSGKGGGWEAPCCDTCASWRMRRSGTCTWRQGGAHRGWLGERPALLAGHLHLYALCSTTCSCSRGQLNPRRV